MQRDDIFLNKEELETIWEAALKHKHDFDKFQKIFSEGFYKGIQKIQNNNNKEIMRKELYLSAKKGDFDKFKSLFETGIMQVNEHFHGKTLLYAVIKSDTQSENDLATLGRKQIAKYLLEKGADVDLQSESKYYCADETRPSPWEMCEYYQERTSNTWFNKLSSMWASIPQYGLNIFPILKEHREKINQQPVP